MPDLDDTKFIIDVQALLKPIQVPRESLDAIKGAVGGKMMARMKREAVNCPVMNRVISFAECFACENFLRRVKGKVNCRGLQLQQK